MASGPPYTHQFTDGRRVVTVTMLEPQTPTDQGVKIGLPVVFTDPDQGTDRIGTVRELSGYLCPATFRVDGLPYRLTFTTAAADPVTRTDPADPIVRIASLTVTFDGLRPPDVDLPTRRLLNAALHASRTRVLRIPAGFRAAPDTGHPLLYVVNNPADAPVYLTIGPDGAGPSRADIRKLSGAHKRRTNAVTDELLQQVADAHRNAAQGEKTKAVGQAVTVSASRARELVRKARDRGFLEAVPDTDKRRRKEGTQ